MRTPTHDTIKSIERNFYLVRKSTYNGGISEKVEWQVWEKHGNVWRLDREHKTKRDALHWLYVCAKV